MINTEKCFRGLQKTSLLDFPGRIACVLFAGGCNFRCPYCYNATLVRCEEPEVPWEMVTDFLNKRRNVLQGVCVSGGEPTQAPFVQSFLRSVKALGLATKIDTNGYHPEVVHMLLKENLVDFVALDIKNSPEKYAATCGLDGVDLRPIEESLALILDSGVAYELRTTVADSLHCVDDIRSIVAFTGKGARYALQPVQSGTPTLSGHRFVPPPPTTLRRMGEVLESAFSEVIIHGM